MENERKSSQLDSLVENKINMHVKSANNLLALCNHLIRSIDEIITRITSQKDNQHSPKSNEARGLNGKPTNLILSYSFSLSLSFSFRFVEPWCYHEGAHDFNASLSPLNS